MIEENKELGGYLREDFKKVVSALKGELPIDIKFSDGNVDILDINDKGWVNVNYYETGKNENIRVKELVCELINHNKYLVDYILTKNR